MLLVKTFGLRLPTTVPDVRLMFRSTMPGGTRSPCCSISVLAMLVAVSLSAPRSSAAVVLVKDGRAESSIVIRASALESKPHPLKGGFVTPDQKVQLAAADLQEYIHKISGATLPIVGDDTKVGGAVVLVGRSLQTEVVDVSICSGLTPDRREEGFVIHCSGNKLLLAGNEERPYNGTHYAVAELLHRLGVRWYMPTEFGEVVPHRPTINIEDIEFHDAPDFPLRTYWSHLTPEMLSQQYLWKLRNKMQPEILSEMIEPAGDSMLNRYLPDPDLAETRPDLFAKTTGGGPNPNMPNMTNQETVNIVAEKMIADLRQRQDDPQGMHDWLGFSPNDGAPFDLHEETLKLSMGFPHMAGREGVPQDVSISEEWFTFVNAVAELVAKEFPDVVLTTNGYANRDVPPIGVTLHPNVAIMYAAIWADNLKPLNHPASWHSMMRGSMLKRFTELSDKVYTYDYFEMFVSCLTPAPVLRRHAADFPLFKEWGLFGFFHERRAAAYMEFGIPPRYFMARLMWDGDLNLEPPLREFYQDWYGKAAEPARQFWDALEDRMYETPLLGHEDRILPYVYDAELIERLEKSVAAAEQLTDNEPYKTHVKVDRYILDHLKAYLAMHAAEFNGDFSGAADQADEMLQIREDIHRINPFFHMPERLDIKDGRGRPSGVWYWTVDDRRAYYEDLAHRVDGTTGDLVQLLPRHARFTVDPGDMGRITGYYRTDADRGGWHQVDTTRPYYLQANEYLDDKSMPYAGPMWYAFEIDIEPAEADRAVNFCVPTLCPQAWLWVNGQYVGRRGYLEAYIRPAGLDIPVTDAIRPGEKNWIVVRVNTGSNRSQSPEGLLGRAFLYSPHLGTDPLGSASGH